MAETNYRPTPFGELLDRKRKEKKLTVRALARQLGLSHVAVGNVIRGKTNVLGEQYWPQLIDVLDVTEWDLVAAASRSSARVLRPWNYDGRRRELAARMAETVNHFDAGDDMDDEALKKVLDAFEALNAAFGLNQ